MRTIQIFFFILSIGVSNAHAQDDATTAFKLRNQAEDAMIHTLSNVEKELAKPSPDLDLVQNLNAQLVKEHQAYTENGGTWYLESDAKSKRRLAKVEAKFASLSQERTWKRNLVCELPADEITNDKDTSSFDSHLLTWKSDPNCRSRPEKWSEAAKENCYSNITQSMTTNALLGNAYKVKVMSQFMAEQCAKEPSLQTSSRCSFWKNISLHPESFIQAAKDQRSWMAQHGVQYPQIGHCADRTDESGTTAPAKGSATNHQDGAK